jgi:hypothetical protein
LKRIVRFIIACPYFVIASLHSVIASEAKQSQLDRSSATNKTEIATSPAAPRNDGRGVPTFSPVSGLHCVIASPHSVIASEAKQSQLDPCSATQKTEIATSPAAPRNDTGGVPTAFHATSLECVIATPIPVIASAAKQSQLGSPWMPDHVRHDISNPSSGLCACHPRENGDPGFSSTSSPHPSPCHCERSEAISASLPPFTQFSRLTERSNHGSLL